MQLCKVRDQSGAVHVSVLHESVVQLVHLPQQSASLSLSEILHSPDPLDLVKGLLQDCTSALPIDKVQLLAPIDHQEVWAAGVTYKRSREARERESVGAAQFYDLVYTAARPELVFKAT